MASSIPKKKSMAIGWSRSFSKRSKSSQTLDRIRKQPVSTAVWDPQLQTLDMESIIEAIGQGIDLADSTFLAVAILSSCLIELPKAVESSNLGLGRVTGEAQCRMTVQEVLKPML